MSGLSLPLRFDSNGHLARSSGDYRLLESIKSILLTRRGDRISRSGYGCTLPTFLFRDMDYSDKLVLIDDISKAISLNERRVLLKFVDITDDNNGSVFVTIQYESRSTGKTYEDSFNIGEA